jgi:nucleotide-binding universal stress UspA family protein
MYTSIVVGSNGTATSREAVAHAAALASVTGATLHIVHAYVLPSRAAMAAPEMAVLTAGGDVEAVDAASALAEQLANEAKAAGASDVRTHAVAGSAAEALCAVAVSTGADVVVVGNKGMKGTGRILGSVPNKVAHHAPCAVLIVSTC